MRKIFEVIRIIFTIIAIFLLLISILMIILKLLGNSPTEINMTFSIMGILIALQVIIISTLFQIKGDIGELKEFKIHSLEFQKQTIERIKEIKTRI